MFLPVALVLLNRSQHSNPTILMRNRNEDSYDDEDRVSPTKHGRNDVV